MGISVHSSADTIFAHLWTWIFGDSVVSVRFIPALTGVASIIIIGQIVSELGGRTWALILAFTGYLVSPAFLRANALFQPVSFNSLFWLASTWIMIRLLDTKNQKWWLVLGVVFGFGFLNKYSIVFPAFSFVIALSLTKERSLFRSRWLVYGIVAGLIIILPNFLWQYNHQWPVVHHMSELRQTQLIHIRISGFLLMQVFMIFPAFLLFLAGLFFVFFDRSAKQFRAMGWAYVTLVLVLIFLSGKFYYSLGIYPVFFAFGGVAIARYTERTFHWIKYALIVLMVLILLPGLPFSLPLLSFPNLVRYTQKTSKFGMENLSRWEDGTIHELPQDYADMTGWMELAEIVRKAWDSLSPDEQRTTGIFAENYGQAGAIRYYDTKHGLPEPVSFSASFLLWAPDSVHTTALIYVNSDTSDISKLFRDVHLVGKIENRYAREYGVGVYLCRNPVTDFSAFYANTVASLKANYSRTSATAR